MISKLKPVTGGTVVLYCMPEFARGIFMVMVTNYLLYFYQPSSVSGIPNLITQGFVILGVLTLIGLIKAVGHIIDAVTDPIIANISDKCRHKDGRRIPFMKYAAIPYALSALLIFFAPNDRPTLLNNVWVAFFIWAYFIFYTLYCIPYVALLPEMIKEQKKRVNAYTVSSFMYVTGSAVGYVTPSIVAIFKNMGYSALTSWRITFSIFTGIGVVLLLLPAFLIKEKDFVNSVRPTVSLKESLKHTFRNRFFCWITIGQLLEGTAMAFFQACIMFYVVSLLGLPETASVTILAISIVGSLLLYPLVNRIAKKIGKKKPLILGCIMFSAAQFAIYFAADVAIDPMVKAVALAIFVSFPFSVFHILPGAMMADVIQYDTIVHGVNHEGIFSAAKSFITKMGHSLAIMIIPTLTIIGAAPGENIGRLGLKLTAVVAGVFCLASIIAFSFYKESTILNRLKAHEEQQ